jgi:hypothetical protein
MASIFERLSLYPKIKKQEVFSYGKYKKRCNYPNSLIGKEKAIISDCFLLFCSPYASKLQHFQNRLNLESFLLVNLLSLSCV